MSKILYIHHAKVIGGATISLRNLVTDALEHGHSCEVVCADAKIAAIFGEAGATVHLTDVPSINHNTALTYSWCPLDILKLFKAIGKSALSCLALRKILIRSNPDIVHLNSSVLVAQAVLAKISGFPVIWHIRENITPGKLGIRKSLLRAIMNRFADELVFISEMEYELMETDDAKSRVVYNYVKASQFSEYGAEARDAGGPFIALSLGGVSSIKGAPTLIEASGFLAAHTEIHIMGEMNPEKITAPSGADAGASDSKEGKRIRSNVRYFQAQLDIRTRLSTSDVLIFWGTVPHFARPVYEAWLMGKPVIALRMCAAASGITGNNALLVDRDDPRLLAEAIETVRLEYPRFLEKAAVGKSQAIERFSERNFEKIEELYECLGRNRTVGGPMADQHAANSGKDGRKGAYAEK